MLLCSRRITLALDLAKWVSRPEGWAYSGRERLFVR